MPTYSTLLRTFLAELKMTEDHKKTMIIKLADQLHREKIVAIENINKKLSEDLKGYVTKQWIGQCLPSRYKDAEKIHVGHEKTRLSETKMLVQIGDQGLETTLGDLKEEHKRIKKKTNRDESEDFHKELQEELDRHHIDPTTMNMNVFKELQKKIEENDNLRSLNHSLTIEINEVRSILTKLSRHTGFYVKYDNEFNVLHVKE